MDFTMRQIRIMHELQRAIASEDDRAPPRHCNGGASCGL
jgi:hypothetical protein